jgi:predicted amidophosphoribosyltransferase
MLQTVLDFILPPRCRICQASTMGAPDPWVCQDCWLNVDYITSSICYQCGQPLAAPPEGIASAVHRCGACLLHPPPFERARAIGLYSGVLMHVIHAMKYQRIYALLHPLADLLQSQFYYHWGEIMPDLLVPIPLHRRRLRQREFDQASVLALELSRRLDIPLGADTLIRHRYTQSQVGLSDCPKSHL